MTATETRDRLAALAKAAHAGRGAALAGPLPRRDRRHQVRRQRDDRPGAAAGLRRGRRLPALRRAPAGRRARRRPADHRPPRPARHRQRVPRRAAGHHPGGDGRRPDGARRPGRTATSSAWSTSTARSRSACPARTPACSPPSAGPPWSTASRSTSAWSATSTEVDPGAVRALIADGRIPVVSTVARGADGVLYNVNADTAAAALAVALGAQKLVVLTDVEGLYAAWPGRRPRRRGQRDHRRRPGALLPGLAAGMVPKMEACLRAVRGGVPAGARARRPGAARAAARGLHRTKGSARWWCPTRRCGDDRHRRADSPVGRGHDAQLRHPAGGPRPRRGLPGLGRRRPGVPRPARRHRGQRARPRPPGAGRGGLPAGRHARAHLQPVRARAGRPLAERLLAPARRRRPGVLRQLRRRGQRGRVQAVPAHGRTSTRPAAGSRSWPPRAASTAAPWARSR